MTAPASTVPTALAALTSQIQTQVAADANAGAVVVCYGEPAMDEPADIIEIGTDVRRRVNPEVLMGGYDMAGPLKEAYDIDCLVSAWSGSADPVAIVTRAYQLANYVEEAVRKDPSLGTTVLESHPAGTNGGDPKWTPEPVGRLCELTVTVAVFTLN